MSIVLGRDYPVLNLFPLFFRSRGPLLIGSLLIGSQSLASYQLTAFIVLAQSGAVSRPVAPVLSVFSLSFLQAATSRKLLRFYFEHFGYFKPVYIVNFTL